jgi:hypothetical protein
MGGFTTVALECDNTNKKMKVSRVELGAHKRTSVQLITTLHQVNTGNVEINKYSD